MSRAEVRPMPIHAPARVLFVVNDLALGGAQRVVLNQATQLDPLRFTPEVASLEIDPCGAMVPAFEAARIPIHRLRSAKEPAHVGGFRLGGLLSRLTPDLVHTHLAAAGVFGRVAARRHRVPFVVTTLHNLSDWEERRLSPVRWLDRKTLRLADAVVTVSDAVRRALLRVCPRLDPRAVTVRNGVPLDDLLGARADYYVARADLGYTADHFVVGSVARLDPRKGLDTLVDAFALAAARAPQARLLIIGDGPERERLKARARDRGILDRLRMVHHQTRVRSYLAAMDLFAAPSRTEGLGVAIIEALAAGLPVLGARVGGIPEVIEDGVSGRLLVPDSPREWADAIAELAARPHVLARWAEAAPVRARNFSVVASGRALQRVYGHVMGEDETDLEAAA